MWMLSSSNHPHLLCTEIHHKNILFASATPSPPLPPNFTQPICFAVGSCATVPTTNQCYYCYYCKNRGSRRDVRACAFWPELFKPDSMEMEPIQDTQHFDQILERAKELSQPILVDWMAAWCRKCIYLKPKLEKLAVEYDTKMKFYCVDVNNVPQALVKRGNISKMPTIQIWQDGEMKAEVIGGHKAWLVVEEVRQMIQRFVQ